VIEVLTPGRFSGEFCSLSLELWRRNPLSTASI
jgi:hypothetical protein